MNTALNITQCTTQYLQHVNGSSQTNPFLRQSLDTFHAVYYEVVKLELTKRGLPGKAFCRAYLDASLDRIRNRMDMAEFGIPALIRILFAYRTMLPADAVHEIEETLIGFRYWLDEPGEINACYFTENHQILYHSAEYLVGSLFPDRTFPSNGQTGSWHKEHGRQCLLRWMEWRRRFGFSEWCTNYYAEDMIALLGLRFYGEEDVKKKAEELLHMLLLEIALNTFEGHWIGSQGRTYTRYLAEPDMESISPICKLYWGEGTWDGPLADCAVMLAVYDYPCPENIRQIGRDKPPVMINRERMSLNTADAKQFGVDPGDFHNIMFFWGNQTYDAREVIANSHHVIRPDNWMNERIHAYQEMYDLCDLAGIPCDPDPDSTALTQVDLYTYRTPDYGLSCAQDFRKGKQGYQQQPWAAFLGGKARVFTNHPGSQDFMDRPNQMAGNWYLPKAVQHENVVLCIYRTPADCIRMLETHAYFPRKEFDEVREVDGWVLGRKKNAYIALRSLLPARFLKPDPRLYEEVYPDRWEQIYQDAMPYFYHANGHANVWVAEMGSLAQNGSFDRFCDGFLTDGKLEGDTFHAVYHSPSQGEMTLGWNEPLTVKGIVLPVHDYKRYDNPYRKEAFVKPAAS